MLEVSAGQELLELEVAGGAPQEKYLASSYGGQDGRDGRGSGEA